MEWFVGNLDYLIIGAALLVGLGELIRRGRGLSAQRRAVWVRTSARVADVSTFDTERADGDHDRTLHRYVVVFELASGERHAADRTGHLSQDQKDILLPDRVVPIEYDARDPDRFRVLWDELREGEAQAVPEAAARPADAAERAAPVYGPRR